MLMKQRSPSDLIYPKNDRISTGINLLCPKIVLMHFSLIFHFHTPLKLQKTKGFRFSWDIEMEHWAKMY